MIRVKKLNNETVLINPELIRCIESMPDTLLTFTNGEKLLVRNSPQEIVDGIVEFRRKLLATAEL
jgi:flagellar protein FlbD